MKTLTRYFRKYGRKNLLSKQKMAEKSFVKLILFPPFFPIKIKSFGNSWHGKDCGESLPELCGIYWFVDLDGSDQ
jgi:hypothetical protein